MAATMCCCCRIRTLALAIGVCFLAAQTALLAASFYFMHDLEGNVSAVMTWLKEQDVVTDASVDSAVIRKAKDFMAIPVTINIVLMCASSLLLWAAVARNKLLLWPWLLLYGLEWIFFLALLVLVMVELPQPWLKVIFFLVVAPFLIVFAFCWFAVKCFYNYLRDLTKKEADDADEPYERPVTMYLAEPPQHWDHPLPIWTKDPASSPSVLDVAHLQQIDPRYVDWPASVSSSRRKPLPTRLPDGTLVVPISDSYDELTEISEEETTDAEDESLPPSARTRHTSSKSSHSLSDRFSVSRRHRLPRVLRLQSPAHSDDHASVVSLSDKYRQQDEVEVFDEFFYHVEQPQPPPPIRSSSASSTTSNIIQPRGVVKLQ